MKELGLSDMILTTRYAVTGPAGMPGDILSKLNREFVRAIDNPLVQRVVKQDELQTEAMTPEQMTASRRARLRNGSRLRNGWSPARTNSMRLCKASRCHTV